MEVLAEVNDQRAKTSQLDEQLENLRLENKKNVTPKRKVSKENLKPRVISSLHSSRLNPPSLSFPELSTNLVVNFPPVSPGADRAEVARGPLDGVEDCERLLPEDCWGLVLVSSLVAEDAVGGRLRRLP